MEVIPSFEDSMQASISWSLQLVRDPSQLPFLSNFFAVSLVAFSFPVSTVLPFLSPAGRLGAPEVLLLLSSLFEPFESIGNVPLLLV